MKKKLKKRLTIIMLAITGFVTGCSSKTTNSNVDKEISIEQEIIDKIQNQQEKTNSTSSNNTVSKKMDNISLTNIVNKKTNSENINNLNSKDELYKASELYVISTSDKNETKEIIAQCKRVIPIEITDGKDLGQLKDELQHLNLKYEGYIEEYYDLTEGKLVAQVKEIEIWENNGQKNDINAALGYIREITGEIGNSTEISLNYMDKNFENVTYTYNDGLDMEIAYLSTVSDLDSEQYITYSTILDLQNKLNNKDKITLESNEKIFKVNDLYVISANDENEEKETIAQCKRVIPIEITDGNDLGQLKDELQHLNLKYEGYIEEYYDLTEGKLVAQVKEIEIWENNGQKNDINAALGYIREITGEIGNSTEISLNYMDKNFENVTYTYNDGLDMEIAYLSTVSDLDSEQYITYQEILDFQNKNTKKKTYKLN